MQFDRPDAVSAMNDAAAAVGEDGAAWEVIGDPMTPPVDELAAYEEKLRLRLNPSPADKRLEVGGLAWGRIDKDVARLRGLAAAIEDISAVDQERQGAARSRLDGRGVRRLPRGRREDRADARRVSSAVRAAASDLTAALDDIRTLYDIYRGQSLAWHLTFDGLSEPADWWRMWRNDADFLAENCSCAHDSGRPAATSRRAGRDHQRPTGQPQALRPAGALGLHGRRRRGDPPVPRHGRRREARAHPHLGQGPQLVRRDGPAEAERGRDVGRRAGEPAQDRGVQGLRRDNGARRDGVDAPVDLADAEVARPPPTRSSRLRPSPSRRSSRSPWSRLSRRRHPLRTRRRSAATAGPSR